MSVLLEEEPGLTLLIPNRSPLAHFVAQVTNPFGGPFDVISSVVLIREIVGHVHQRFPAERVNQFVVVHGRQIESILLSLREVRTVTVEPYQEDAVGWW